ncbi:hypothetical protein H1R17_06165 [Flavobacterium sp. xlx-214]|uniref:hypothetical protein n=1 Tax=unclassified Flavobacterium TaxID=196869 RepID=UPI0013D5CD3C|nr:MULTISPECIES: hypothetical protein [unclassified Flavobacterium]MBA5792964.1 hypothetical protein [Flavobacterium sp. xlx-221]QMI84703.1 hypothetical protein H1R17_06165 [Flavobacterium sp. xlx-214]
MKKITILCSSVLMLLSCKSDDDIKDNPGVDPSLFANVDLYYSGLVRNNAGVYEFKYWKNDSIVHVSTPEMVVPAEISVQNNDVYLAGYFQRIEGTSGIPLNGAVWKNGTLIQNLKATENDWVTVAAMKVTNNVVHTAGVINRKQVAYWKNGVLNKWANANLFTKVYAMDVVGNDVYILGDTQPEGKSNHVIKYWKNGVEHAVSGPDELAYGGDIKVIGSDVYVLGTVIKNGYKITLWKNGVRTTIGDNYTFGHAHSLFVENSDVYISATMQPKDGNTSPFIFKNGVSIPLEYDTDKGCSLYDLYVNNGDVYAVGSQNSKGLIWKNGKKHEISVGDFNVTLSKIDGVPKKK